MDTQTHDKLKALFAAQPDVGLVYFFGSRARGEQGPMSDYDFALYLDEDDPRTRSERHCKLIAEISHILQTDNIDVVLLNTIQEPELAYAIITEGELLHEREPHRAIIEPRILNAYFDFYALLKAHQLTRA
ncbi:MAG: nucleotidyltransferase domain-containing protein [Patescibacteria group bacterium]